MANKWLGDHPLYPNVESFVLHIIEEFDDSARGVTFEEIYKIIEDFTPDRKLKRFQPSRKDIKAILDYFETQGKIVDSQSNDRSKYYLNYDHEDYNEGP